MNKVRKYKSRGIEEEISEELHKELEKIERRYKYICYLDRKHKLLHYDSFDNDKFRGVDSIVDITTNIEEIVIKNIMLDKLKHCLSKLSDNELYLIENLISQEKSERELSQISGIPQKTINDRKHKILAKLRKLIEN